MLRIFTGDDRVRAKQEIAKFLGGDYEVFDGPDLLADDLLNICLGNSLLSGERSILIQDLSKNKSLFEKLPSYLETPHKIAILEHKIDKRSATYKALNEKKLIQSFELSKSADYGKVFNIYSIAKHDSKKAVKILENIKDQEDPIMFFGLLVSSALKDYNNRQGIKEKRALKLLSQLDLSIKSSPIDSWLIIESFLMCLPRI